MKTVKCTYSDYTHKVCLKHKKRAKLICYQYAIAIATHARMRACTRADIIHAHTSKIKTANMNDGTMVFCISSPW